MRTENQIATPTLAGTNGIVAKTMEQEFKELASQWRAERAVASSAKRMAQHPAYRRIVAMGVAIVPLLLAQLEAKPEHWFLALQEITGVDPVKIQHRGILKEMAADWIQWGRDQGYKW